MQSQRFPDKLSDLIAKFGGSWYFILGFLALTAMWILYNTYSFYKFDNPPFILLNLIYSIIAALQAPFLLMCARRQEEKDRKRDVHHLQTTEHANKVANEVKELVKEANDILNKMEERYKQQLISKIENLE